MRIDLAGKICVWLISLIGIAFLIYYKRNHLEFNYKSWAAVLLSLFYMRDVVIYLFFLVFKWLPCGEAKPFFYLGLSLNFSLIIFTIIGFLLLLTNTLFIPKKHWLLFAISGFLGSILGFIIWYKFTHLILLL